MYSTRTNLWSVVKRQLVFKLKANSGMFITMMVVQAIALFFLFSGMSGTSSSSTGQLQITIRVFSGSGLIAFTLIWAAIIAFALTTEISRNSDFAFVSNRLSSNFANVCFLALASVLAGFTAVLGSILLRNLIYVSVGVEHIIANNFYLGPGELLTGLVATVFYMFVVSALGYMFGALVQLFKPLVVILPAVLLGSLIMEARTEFRFLLRMVDFLITESALLVFVLKALVVAILMFGAAALITNKLEVRR
ncbi:MAG: hypothetical protein FH749_04680 [Firmicutes bacterium]|nr:hypothetical protein [Bacillota bacterium]